MSLLIDKATASSSAAKMLVRLDDRLAVEENGLEAAGTDRTSREACGTTWADLAAVRLANLNPAIVCLMVVGGVWDDKRVSKERFHRQNVMKRPHRQAHTLLQSPIDESIV